MIESTSKVTLVDVT